MKRRMGVIVSVVLMTALSSNVLASSVKKNAPDKKTVETELKALGGEHFPERMRIQKIGPVRVGDTYYHVFSGQLPNVGYHIIIYDNDQHYLGFYATEFEPINYEEGGILLNSADGEDYYHVPINADGPPKKVLLPEGLPLVFVPAPKAPKAEAGATTTAPKAASGKDGITAEYREWTITRKGKTMKVRAIYVSQSIGTVVIKAETNGKTAKVRLSELSRKDQEYVRKFK